MTILKTERPIRVLISGNCLGAPLEAAAAEAARIFRIPLDVRYIRNYADARGLEPSADIELKDFARQADFFRSTCRNRSRKRKNLSLSGRSPEFSLAFRLASASASVRAMGRTL
jgi:hypothetical protein